MEKIDRKFSILARSREHGNQHTEDDAVLFLAKDKALPETLRFYREECERIGADARQLLGIALLCERVETYQRLHPERLKVPDVDESPEGDRIVRPNAEVF